MLNFERMVAKSIPKDVVQPRRGQIYVGFQCHQGCGFCYYGDRCSEPMFDFDTVRKQVDFEREYGIREFEITGGEPSECMNLRKACEYIRDAVPESRIAVITNGGLHASDVWDLIDEVLLSYHVGRDTTGAEMSMFPKGNTYQKALKTVEKASSSGVMLRTNTVLGTFNLDNADRIVDDIVGFRPRIVNFLPVNIFDGAGGMSRCIDYARLRPVLKRQIDRIAESLPNSLVFARYMPFCGMEGYERHIVGHLQHVYDWFDWNVELDGIGVLGMVGKKPMDVLGPYGSTSIRRAFELRASLYEKSPACLRCKYNIMCDGMERNVPGLLSQAIPSRGSLVVDPTEHVWRATRALHKETYGKDESCDSRMRCHRERDGGVAAEERP